jgi:uncharacterized protein (UPF0276 family)
LSGTLPALGVGLGYRPRLHHDIMSARDDIDWLELIAENFLPLSPRRRDLLAEITSKFVCVLHCTELSLGSEAPLDGRLVAELAELAEITAAPWVSDHCCFTTAGGVRLGHLAPVRWTKANAALMAGKARAVSRELGRPFLLENIAYHFVVPGELREAQFIASVLEESGCYLLLDVANVFANATNLGFDPFSRLDEFPLHRIGQMHIAGGTWEDGVLADSHDAPVPDGVWELLRHVACRAEVPAVLLERDAAFPDDFGEILSDLKMARLSACPGQRDRP